MGLEVFDEELVACELAREVLKTRIDQKTKDLLVETMANLVQADNLLAGKSIEEAERIAKGARILPLELSKLKYQKANQAAQKGLFEQAIILYKQSWETLPTMLSLNKFRILLLLLSFFLALHWEPNAFGSGHVTVDYSPSFDFLWASICLLGPPFLLIFSLLSTRKFYPEYWRQHELKSRLLNPLLTAIGWCGLRMILPPVFLLFVPILWFFSLCGVADFFLYQLWAPFQQDPFRRHLPQPFLGLEYIVFAFVGVMAWRSCEGIKRWKKVFVTFWRVMFSIGWFTDRIMTCMRQ